MQDHKEDEVMAKGELLKDWQVRTQLEAQEKRCGTCLYFECEDKKGECALPTAPPIAVRRQSRCCRDEYIHRDRLLMAGHISSDPYAY